MNHADLYALSIAGFDPSAGAGVLADVKTFEANGVYGFGVVSALTWQNDKEFERVEWISLHNIVSQIEMLLRRFHIRYFKIGLIENAEVLAQLILYLKTKVNDPILVFDPVLKATAGFEFHSAIPEKFAAIARDIFCITPNIPEAGKIFGSEDLEGQLELWSETVNIYLKGGHGDAATVIDFLYTSDHTYAFSNDRLPHGEKHGSGCVLSAALTAQLALGKELPLAAEIANSYTYRFLASTDTLLGHHKPLRQ